jgi:class 3 adenylate cyclase/S1-C subfamily serine protease
MSVCRVCGLDAPGDSDFCAKCGTRLTPQRPHPEERRTVTSLFCDLVGFTALSERADAEDIDALLRRYDDMARRVVESYGGVVEKFIGDAVVAVFGVPTAHEDDPERAVRAALRLIEEVEELEPLGESAVRVRIGVNSGEVLVSLDVDPGRGQGFLTGDAVNVAARLQAAAPPMGVVVGEGTHQATQRIFDYDECAPLTLKGKSGTVRAWLAGPPRARTGSELRSFSSVFIGREMELDFLKGLLAAVQESCSPQIGLLVGEPGIGKSRLVAELGHYLDELPEPVAWCQGRCLPYGEGVTFWPLGEIVKAYGGILETDGVARVEAALEVILPEGEDKDWYRQRLRPLLGLEAGQVTREENFRAWRRFLEQIAASGPTVLVFEDLHWADSGMLAFLDYLLESTARVPLLVLGTARPEVLDLSGDGASFVQHARRLSLGPLSPVETAQLVLARLSASSLPASLQAAILERSGGNPLFAEEMARLVEDRELLVRKGGVVTLKDGAELPLPESIQALIAARLDVLAPRRKALLADAAVVGRTFWAGAVAAVGDYEPGEVFEGLHELVAKELVRPVRGSSMAGETEFVFLHVLMRDVAYNQLPRAARAEKHAAVAEWIEEKTRGRAEDLSEILAYHYATALDLADASGLTDLAAELNEPTARYLSLSGDRALPLDSVVAHSRYVRSQEIVRSAHPRRLQIFRRRTRRARRKAGPLLIGVGLSLVVAVIAALTVWALLPSKTPSSAGASSTSGATLSSSASLTAAEIQQQAGPSVVRITSTPAKVTRWGDGSGQSSFLPKHIVGSGFLATKDGVILTSATVLRANEQTYPAFVTVEYADSTGHYGKATGTVWGVDEATGVAVIKVDPREVPLAPIPLGNSDSLVSGQSVVALSAQAHVTISLATGSLTALIKGHDADSGNLIVRGMRDDMKFPRSGIGGPVIDASGHVVGIVGPVALGTGGPDRASNSWQLRGNEAIAIRVGVGDITWFSKQNYGKPTDAIRQRLGLAWVWVGPSLAPTLGLTVPRGALVQGVAQGGAAAKAGLRGGDTEMTVDGTTLNAGGDVIVAADGVTLRDENQLITIVNRHHTGDVVVLTIVRDGRTMALRVTIAASP